jgi:hypothetical protein
MSVVSNLFELEDPFLTFKDLADLYTVIDFDKNVTTKKLVTILKECLFNSSHKYLKNSSICAKCVI